METVNYPIHSAEIYLSFFSKYENIVIFPHVNPDGDAIGSTLAFRYLLEALGKTVHVVVPNTIPSNLFFLPGVREIIVAKNDPEKANQLIKSAELHCHLDHSSLKRIDFLQDICRETAKPRFMMDHHLEPSNEFDLGFWDTEASSTCELVYKFMTLINEKSKLDYKIATCIYTGLVTDTGSFKYSCTTPEVHRIASRLLETGIQGHIIQHKLFSCNSENRTRFLGYCLKEKLKIIPNVPVAYFAITAEELENFNLQEGDTEGIVNYALGIEGVLMGISLFEKEGKIRMSFRSVSNVPAVDFAKEFGGGGHFNAAGAKSDKSLSDTEQKLIQIITEKAHLLRNE